jgi:hypothetical protein
MKRTRPWPLAALGLAGALVGFFVQLGLAAGGRPILAPPITLPITLVAAGAVVVVFAIPIHRSIRGPIRREINPFQAMRVVVLAKASSLVGGLVGGFGVGCVVYVATRTLVPGAAVLWLGLATAVGGVLLLIAGLIAEQLCALPPDDSAPED